MLTIKCPAKLCLNNVKGFCGVDGQVDMRITSRTDGQLDHKLAEVICFDYSPVSNEEYKEITGEDR